MDASATSHIDWYDKCRASPKSVVFLRLVSVSFYRLFNTYTTYYALTLET